MKVTRSAEPIVSVVMATRNRADRLAVAVDSVKSQTVEHWELIVVDDASSDDTPRLLADLARGDPRIRSIRLDGRRGAAAARNVAIAESRGAYIALLDDDCEFEPSSLERRARALDEAGTEVGLAYCPTRYIDAAGRERIIGSSDADTGDPWRVLLCRNFIDTSAALIRRELLERIGGFDARMPRLQDWDLWLRLARITAFRFVPEPLVRARFTPGGISSRPRALIVAGARLVRKHRVTLRSQPELLSDLYAAMGHAHLIGGAPRIGRRYLARAIQAYPGAPRAWILGCISLLGTTVYVGLIRLRERMIGSWLDRIVQRFWDL